jgi:hypothetical protein
VTTIDRLREHLGAPGRRDPQFLSTLALRERPAWAVAGPIRALFDHQRDLLAQGSVCWAYLVMANMVLWRPGPEPYAAADVVWSEDPFVDRFPYWLSRPAMHLRHYHEEATGSPNPPLAYREYLQIRDETMHVSHSLLPPHMTEGRAVYSQTVLLVRAHLPQKQLTGRLFPLLQLRAPNVTPTAMVLPSSLWPTEVRRVWERA